MRCLILLIIISIVFIASVIDIVKIQDYRFLFNIVVIPIILAGIYLSLSELALVTTVAVFMGMSLFFLGVGFYNILSSVIFIIAVAAAARYIQYITESVLICKDKVLAVIEEENLSASDFNEKIDQDKLRIEKMVHDISSLYQAPKEMISSITLEELITSLKKSVEGYFEFSKCKLIIFSFTGNDSKIENVYNIPENKDDSLSGYEEVLANIMRGKRGPLVVDRTSKMMPPENLRLSDKIETFLAIPLVSGNRFNGIFVIENIHLDDMVRFIILAHQFAIVLERIRLYELVQELAIRDGLTDVFVRRYFLDRLDEEIERAKHYNTNLSFIMLDIDYFKKCNDKYGHLVGDIALKEISKILQKSLREIDIIGRYGGEEFAIMLPDTSKEGAVIVGERIRESVEKSEINAYDEVINLTVSLGIATYPVDADELSQLIDRADQMLYKAKEDGRNRVRSYEQKR